MRESHYSRTLPGIESARVKYLRTSAGRAEWIHEKTNQGKKDGRPRLK